MKGWVRRLLLVAVDLVVLLGAGLLCLALWQDGALSPAGIVRYARLLGGADLTFVLSFGLLGLYRRLWQYASIRDLLAAGRASALAGLLLLAVIPGPIRLRVLYWLVATLALGSCRLAVRAWRELGSRGRASPVRRLLIVGAGDAGVALARELSRQAGVGLSPVGFVDDAFGKQGQWANGLPVVGPCKALVESARRLKADEVVIAMPSAPGQTIRAIWMEAITHRLPVRILPPLRDLSLSQRLAEQLRQVRLEDLLGRPEVRIDLDAVTAVLKNRRIMVTGAGGSIGSELCRQAAGAGSGELVLLGHGENSLFEVEGELRQRFPHLTVHTVICDIQDQPAVERAFKRYRPEVLFHAAAHKHVPLMERNPAEAIKNNILGTYNLASAADRIGVERFVLISTDKAVNPSSVMGATKRVAERILRVMAARSSTHFMTVRFGNVLGSRGSVVPIFQQQIARGGPVTITHPEATRYFMTIPEAARLVIQAGATGRSGDLFLLDMGEPVKVLDLATDLIRLAGLSPEAQIPIAYTGLRPGEKLTEELATGDEQVGPTSHARIARIVTNDQPTFDLAGALERFRSLSDQDQITPAAILAVLETETEGGAELSERHCELVHELV